LPWFRKATSKVEMLEGLKAWNGQLGDGDTVVIRRLSVDWRVVVCRACRSSCDESSFRVRACAPASAARCHVPLKRKCRMPSSAAFLRRVRLIAALSGRIGCPCAAQRPGGWGDTLPVRRARAQAPGGGGGQKSYKQGTSDLRPPHSSLRTFGSCPASRSSKVISPLSVHFCSFLAEYERAPADGAALAPQRAHRHQ